MNRFKAVTLLTISVILCASCVTGCGENVTSKVSEYVDKEVVDEVSSKVKEKSKEALSKLKEEAKAEIREKGSELKSEIKEKSDELALEALEEKTKEYVEESSVNGILESTADIEIHDEDGNGTRFTFTYGGEEFSALYRSDNWQIIDSYLITNSDDMMIICQALIDIHPIHGADMESYRTPEDMAYEWLQHNLAYDILPEDNYWRQKAKDVDLNPADQGKTLAEMYEIKTGKKLSISELFH
jgi:hypothetical protein